MNCSSDKSRCTTRCLGVALLAITGVAALGGVVMLLWNWLMPVLFVGAQPVGYGQALGILLLSKILFGGFRGGCHGRWRGRQQRWEGMTPDERNQLKGHFVSRWGNWCGAEKSKEDGKDEGGGRQDHAPDQVARP